LKIKSVLFSITGKVHSTSQIGTKPTLHISITQGSVGARASCASEVGVGPAGGSIGASALFGYFLGKQKVTGGTKSEMFRISES
jgi:hypothetical protein